MESHIPGLNRLADGAVLKRVLMILAKGSSLYAEVEGKHAINIDQHSKYNDPGRPWVYNFEPEASYKELCSYALVSRQWFGVLKPYIFSTVYVKALPPCPADPPATATWKRLLQRKQPVKRVHPWVSNVKCIIAMGGESYVRQICIDDYETSHPLVLPELLDRIGFGTRVWENIRICSLSGHFLSFYPRMPDADVVESTYSYLRATCPAMEEFGIGRVHGVRGDEVSGKGNVIVALCTKFDALARKQHSG